MACTQLAGTLGQAVVQHQLAQQRLVARADRDTRAPMRATGHRRHAHAAHLCEGVVVMHPAPAVAGAQRLHQGLAKDIRQRLAEQVQQGQ
jgi:aspartate carbamoyltransferase catalytic subunit